MSSLDLGGWWKQLFSIGEVTCSAFNLPTTCARPRRERLAKVANCVRLKKICIMRFTLYNVQRGLFGFFGLFGLLRSCVGFNNARAICYRWPKGLNLAARMKRLFADHICPIQLAVWPVVFSKEFIYFFFYLSCKLQAAPGGSAQCRRFKAIRDLVEPFKSPNEAQCTASWFASRSLL